MAVKKPKWNEIIQQLVPHLVTHYNPLQEVYDSDEKYYELEFKDALDLPKEFKSQGIVLPTARDMVDAFVDHIDISNARVFCNKKGAFKYNEKEQEALRKFGLGMIHRTNVEADISPWRVAAKHYALHGVCIFKDLWVADMWPDKPIQQDGESEEKYVERLEKWQDLAYLTIPIVIQAVHPKNVMPDPQIFGRQYVVERQTKLQFDIKRKHPLWPTDKKAGDEVEWVSYWDDTYRADFADGLPLLPYGGVIKHNYGFLPYVVVESGLGNLSSTNEMQKRYVGMLRYIFDMLKSESRDYSIADIMLARLSWGGGFLIGENANLATNISQKFGEWNKLPDGVEPKSFAELMQLPPDALSQHLGITADYVAAHAAPRSVRGLGETGVRSGADRRLVIAEASARYQYSKDAFRNGTARVLENCAKLLKNVIPGDVRVWAKGPAEGFDEVIKRDDIKEPFNYYVEFAPISEEDEYRRHDDLERLVNAGIGTIDWARSQMSNIDPIKMDREDLKQKLRNSPGYLQTLDAYLQYQMQQALGVGGGENMPPEETGEPGRQLVPPSSPKPVPGSPEYVQLQMKKMRSQVPMNQQGQGGGGMR